MIADYDSLVGDIGGTNARFALVKAGQLDPESIRMMACRDYQGLDNAIYEYFRQVGGAAARDACLAVAATPSGASSDSARVTMTNSHWRFDIEHVRRQFGWEKLRLINDYTAMALGIPHVRPDRLVRICGGPGNERRPRLVIGPGTGLGVSALVPSRNGWLALMTEGGHVDFAATNDTELSLLKILRNHFGRVSAERVLSGPGLLNLYRAHGEMQGLPATLSEPEDVTKAALAGSDPLAGQTLEHFCEILGRVAGNAALTLGSTGGVYLCGGILPGMIDFLKQSRFKQAFTDKGRMGPMLERMPVYVVTERHTGLFGAAAALTNPEIQNASDDYR